MERLNYDKLYKETKTLPRNKPGGYMGKKHETRKHMPNKHTEHVEETTAHEEKSTKGFSKTTNTIKKIFWNEKALIVLLILIAITFSTVFRMYPATLPVAQSWAEETYYNQIENSIAQQVSTQYPNLPSTQKSDFVNKQLQEYIDANKDQLQPQIDSTAEYFKEQMQNENGQTYLLAIDPYVWYSNAKNIEKYGMVGDEVVDGKVSFSLRKGQEPKFESATLHPYFSVLVHKIGSFFNKDFTLLKAIFIVPVIIIALAIIAGFFLGRKIAGNLGGFVAGMIIALNTALLGRTPAGFSDTDAYIILFPILISWLFIESLTAKKIKNKLLLMGVASLAYGLFAFTWQNTWHIGAILLGVLGIYFIYSLITERKKLGNINKKNIFENKTTQIIALGLVFLAGIFIFSGFLTSSFNPNTSFGSSAVQSVKAIFIQPLNALSVKSVASTDIWPNVLTTVAELNEGSWSQVISSSGGKFFFIIGIIGILLTLTLRTENDKFEIRYAALLGIWSIVLIVAGLMSGRFIALLAAPFAIAFGSAFGILWMHAKKIKSKDFMVTGRILLLIIVAALFIAPIGQAHRVALQEVPSMNDAWYESLTTIKNDPGDGIITSWWDFGHWFVNIAEKRVTFDGGDQGKRIYWVGKSLMTNNLTENKDILRMLNCGENTGYERLVEYTNNNYLSTQLINTIIYEDKDVAKTQLIDAGLSEEESNLVLEKTHCSDDQLLNQYYIVSQDMVGKTGVWAHFGGWDFKRAYVYNLAKKQNYDVAMQTIQDKLGYTEEQAAQLYFEANSLTNNREVDSWISSWPQYITSNSKACQETNTTVVCTMSQVLTNQQGTQVVLDKVGFNKENPSNVSLNIINVQNGAVVAENIAVPAKFTLGNEDGWTTYETEKNNFPYEIVVGKTESGAYRAIAAEDEVADSAFSKLFFFDGLGMDGYEKISDKTSFRGERIIVYKVNLQE